MKKTICLILALFMVFAALPFTAQAAEPVQLEISDLWDNTTELHWTYNGEYDGVIIQKSTDNVSWSQAEDYAYMTEYYSVELSPKTVSYYRVLCYTVDWETDERTYTAPSNSVEVYSGGDTPYSYCNAQKGKAVIEWEVYKTDYKYYDGFDIYGSINGAATKKLGSVAVGKYKEKTNYYYNYSKTVKSLPKDFYTLSYQLRPYFLKGDKKYYLNNEENEPREALYINPDIAKVTTKKTKVKITLKQIAGISKYKIKYTKYKLKSGKSYKTKTVSAKKSYTIKNTDSKNYGYYIEVCPVVSGKTLDYSLYLDSHDAYSLLNGASRVKKKSIKVVNTRGKKAYTDWTYKLSAKDKKTIKKFFNKKYKGKNPSRAEMAEYALNWINRKVTYDYDYKYGGLSYVDAIFNKRHGQCLQYNGAYAAVLTYLGYEARVIEGYRANYEGKPTISHFWCEVKLNGRWYLCETGNYGKNGYWQYFVSLYRNSHGYTKYGKEARDE